MRDAVQSWIDLNPEYSYHFFDDKAQRKFIQKYFSRDVLDAYDNLIPGAFKSDLWRYCILYRFGGIYVDISTVCQIPLDQIIQLNDEFISVLDRPTSRTAIYNAFIACIPRHPFLKEAIDMIVENVKNKTVTDCLGITGPILLGRAINRVLGRSENTPFKVGQNYESLPFRLLYHPPESGKILTAIDGDIFYYPKYAGFAVKDVEQLSKLKHYGQLCKENKIYKK